MMLNLSGNVLCAFKLALPNIISHMIKHPESYQKSINNIILHSQLDSALCTTHTEQNSLF